MRSLVAVVTIGVATLVELFGYDIPYIDNLLDAIAIPLATIAGTAVMVSTVADLSPAITRALASIVGGVTAKAVIGSSGLTGLACATTIGGLANPIVSAVETGSAIVMSILWFIYSRFSICIRFSSIMYCF